MALKKNFLQCESLLSGVSNFRLIVGFVTGLLYAFSFYAFLYMFRETFRLMSVTESYKLWILTDDEVNFYNLFFAFVSVILAQSICFQLWFEQPGRVFRRFNYRKTSIIHDQRVLTWYFLSWFSKGAISFGLMFGMTFQGGFYVFSFYPDYNYLFILIIVVLYLQTWNTIRLTFKRKSLKWMIASMILVSIVAFSLSRINLIDYKRFNENIQQKNILNNYNLELPETDCYEGQYSRSYLENIYVVKSKNPNETQPVLVVDNKVIELKQLNGIISKWQSEWSEYQTYRIIYQLHIDKSIKMVFVNALKEEMSKSEAYRIGYAVTPNNPEYNTDYYNDISFNISLPNRNPVFFEPQEIYERVNRIQNIIDIRQDTAGEYLINNVPVDVAQIKQTIKRLVQENPEYIIKYHISDSTEFSNYFQILIHSKEAMNELRDDYSKANYSKQYDELDYKAKEEVRRKFPLRIFDLTEEFMELLKKE